MKRFEEFVERNSLPFFCGLLLSLFLCVGAFGGRTACSHCNSGECACCRQPPPESPGPATGDPRTLLSFGSGPAQRSPGNK